MKPKRPPILEPELDAAFHVAIMHDTSAWSPPPRVSLLYLDAGENAQPNRGPNQISPHAHAHWQLELLLAGKATARFGRRKAELTPGSIVLLPPETRHAFVFHNPRKSWSLKFATEGLQGSLPPRLLPAHAPVTEILCRAFAHLFDTFDMHPIEARHYEALEHMLGALLALAYRRNTAGVVRPDWLIETRELIARKCAEGMTAEVIASEIGYSPGHLSRLFRNEAGISLKTFYDAERARLALEKIVGTDRSIKTIAGEMGFRDVYVFSKFIKRLTGKPPTAHRAHGRNRM